MTKRWTNRDYLFRARRILGMRFNYFQVRTVLWNHTGFPFVGMRMTLQQVRQFKRGECDCFDCRLVDHQSTSKAHAEPKQSDSRSARAAKQ